VIVFHDSLVTLLKTFETIAAFYGSVSASFTVEQGGLPTITNADGSGESWNGDQPHRRLAELRSRLNTNFGGTVNK